MEIKKAHLTIKLMKSLSPGRAVRYCDTDVNGLQVWVGARSVAFYLRKRSRGKEYTIKIGNWPDITLEEARKKSLDKLGSLANFGVPDAPTGREHPLCGEAIDYYISIQQTEQRKKNMQYLLGHFSHWRNRHIEDITRDELQKILDKMKCTPGSANVSVHSLITAFNLMFKKIGKPFTSPSIGLKWYKPKFRQRYVTQEEAPRFFAALDKFANGNRFGMMVDIVLMLLYTGARKNNVCEMCIEEIDNGVWTIPEEKYKARHAQRIQLGTTEMAIIEKYRAGRTSGFVFPHAHSLQGRLQYFFYKLCDEANLKDLHIHDIRRTIGTWMLSNGTPIAVVSKKLGHSSIKITEQVYAHIMPDVSMLATNQAIEAMRGQNGTSSKSEYSSSLVPNSSSSSIG